MNSTCFLTFSQYMLLHDLFLHFCIFENRTNTSTFVFILLSTITGRSWADHGATIGDHAKHARFEKILTPLRDSQISKFQRFFRNYNEQHVFQNIECSVPIIVKNDFPT